MWKRRFLHSTEAFLRLLCAMGTVGAEARSQGKKPCPGGILNGRRMPCVLLGYDVVRAVSGRG